MWRTLWGSDGFGAFEGVSFGAGVGIGQRVGASVHHDRVHAVGHGEGLQVRLYGHGQRQFVDEVNRSAGDDRPTAQVLKTEHSVGPPELLHAVPHEDDAGQLRERLDDVEVAERTDLEERHAVLLGVRARLLRGNLPLKGQVQTVPHQDPRDSRGMLVYLSDPSVDSVKRPAVCDVVDQQNALSSTRVRPEDGAESALSRRVPQLQLHSSSVQEDRRGFVVDSAAVGVGRLR